MKQESHRLLGRYLMGRLPQRPTRTRSAAFYMGCVEPDRNPLSYCKGSIRARWFYGHNYQNAQRWIDRTIGVLERRRHWTIYDYYRLGKLIHYTSDAFTYVHNNCFRAPIRDHRAYEDALQDQFLRRLDAAREARAARMRDLAACFRDIHAQYLTAAADVQRDCRYILEMTERIFCQLLPEAAAA
ncbi:MAG: zinc dependent phospholipase C family protein [Oscillospiraceae bacterium]|nr:zinc dependent phospholipase C family protein [Oscillospiraceae bacterium]